MTGPPRQAIEARLAAGGLPPLPRLVWLELDLDALASNLAILRDLGGGAPIHPVVKADAYGHGAVPISRALAAAGADGLSVATMDEALELRAAGIQLPIRVMYAIPPALGPDAARERITVAAGDLTTVGDLLAATEAGAGAVPLRVEIEVETGLGRGGVPPEGIVPLARLIAASPAAELVAIWTHLQASEDAANTAHQLARFEDAAIAFRDADLPVPPRHVAASGGLLIGIAGFEGVRPGLSIYGIVPDELAGRTLAGPGRTLAGPDGAGFRPVMSLHARPARVADLPPGHGVSYGPTFRTSRPSRIATLAVGYGDGYARANANRAEALVRGRRVPLVGNVTMDAAMFDVTDVAGSPIGPDDEFVLLGSQGDERISAEDLARLRNTNTWEVVVQMAGRLPRVYHAAAGAVGLRTLTERRG